MSGSARARLRFPRLTIILCVVAASAPLSARGQANQPVAAEALFREARKLVDEGRFAEACEKFAASEKLEAAVGTLLNLGRCYEKLDRTAAAWATYHEAIAVANATGQSEREKIARERADSLEPTLPRLTITVSAQPSGTQLTIKRDGETVLPDLWGVTVPVDPGEHVVEANAPGKKAWSGKTRVQARQVAALVVPSLEADEAAAPALAAGIVPVDADSGNAEPAAPQDGEWNGKKTAAVVLAGAGALGLAVATVEGLTVLEKKSDYDRECGSGSCGEPHFSNAQAILDDAQQARTLAIVAGAAGGVSLVAAAVFWLTSGRSPAAAGDMVRLSPMAGARRVGLEVSGRW